MVLSISIAVANAIIFDCHFFYGHYEWGDYKYTCSPTIIHSDHDEVLVEVNGVHIEGKNDTQVEMIWVRDGQILTFIPRGIDEFFPNLRGLTLHYTCIAEISANDLQQFPNLIDFNVFGNPIVSLDGDLFKHNTFMRYIYFGESLLQHVGFNLLGDLNNLRNVYFISNPCVNDSASWTEEIADLNQRLPILCPQPANDFVKG